MPRGLYVKKDPPSAGPSLADTRTRPTEQFFPASRHCPRKTCTVGIHGGTLPPAWHVVSACMHAKNRLCSSLIGQLTTTAGRHLPAAPLEHVARLNRNQACLGRPLTRLTANPFFMWSNRPPRLCFTYLNLFLPHFSSILQRKKNQRERESFGEDFLLPHFLLLLHTVQAFCHAPILPSPRGKARSFTSLFSFLNWSLPSHCDNSSSKLQRKQPLFSGSRPPLLQQFLLPF